MDLSLLPKNERLNLLKASEEAIKSVDGIENS